MCEDKGIEKFDQLQSIAGKDNIYSNLCEIFKKADEKYNSGLFHFKKERNRNTLPDELTLKLIIDDSVLKNIFRHLYYPNSPYEFSVISPEILGNVYEQFLGKIIRLTEGHRAKIEEKPEVKKAGGVYYTPQYIVEYIVNNTVGKLIKSKSPKEILKIKILDPACGSGSFLLGAYSKLLQYHLNYYSNRKNPNRCKDQIYFGKDGNWYLTIKEKKRILLNNIFGVDIDSQAVEVTKLSLLLKVLEGESKDVFEKQQKLWTERALPDLGDNIKCGNSIISTDIFSGSFQTTLIGEDEIYQINPFNWYAEFESIMNNGGFDVVIGNPPYVRMEELSKIKGYLRKYSSFAPRADLYTYFIERAFKLTKNKGCVGLITSNKWMKAKYGGPLRKYLAKKTNILEIVDFGELPVFQSASTFPSILIAKPLNKEKRDLITEFNYVPIKELKPHELSKQVNNNSIKVKEGPNHKTESWKLTVENVLTRLLKYPKNIIPLSKWLEDFIIGWGIKTGYNKAFYIDNATYVKWKEKNLKIDEVVKPLLIGDEIRRYQRPKPNRYLIYANRGFNLNQFDCISKQLYNNKTRLSKRATIKSHPWYELQQPQPRYAPMLDEEKIVWPEIAKEPRFTLIDKGIYINNKCFFTNCNSKYLLGLLNSKLIWEILKIMCSCLGDVNKGGRLELRQQYLQRVPIRKINFSDQSDKNNHDKIVNLVEKMFKLNQYLNNASTENQKTILKRQIKAIDTEINHIIYELYGLEQKDIINIEEH